MSTSLEQSRKTQSDKKIVIIQPVLSSKHQLPPALAGGLKSIGFFMALAKKLEYFLAKANLHTFLFLQLKLEAIFLTGWIVTKNLAVYNF